MDKEKNHLINQIYGCQRQSSKARNHPPPDYTNIQLKSWLILQKKFHVLFDDWVLSGYKSDKKPSVNRLNDYEPYTLENIELVTWAENRMIAHDDFKTGKNNKLAKRILQYNLNGEFLKEHHSGVKAEKETGVNNSCISLVCHGKLKTAGGFIWKFKTF